MQANNTIQILRDKHCQPTPIVLENAMEPNIYKIYNQLISRLNTELTINYQWHYYNDGKAWLCKFSYNKKTVQWLSVWQGFLKTSFYFTEKTKAGVLNIDISDEIKDSFVNAKPIGKLIPLVIDIFNDTQINSIIAIAEYKLMLK